MEYVMYAVGAIESLVTVNVFPVADTLPAASVSVVTKLFVHSAKAKQFVTFVIV
jgi:hypothetical protein